MTEDFFRKQNHRGASAQIFFTIVVEKPLTKCVHLHACIPPFTAKRGHFRQSCKGRSCMRFSWHVFEMNVVIFVAVDEFFERFLTSTLSYLGVKLTPRGEFVLENFFIKRKVRAKTPIFSLVFKKCQKISSENKITAERLRKFFLPSSLKNLWQNVFFYTPVYLPLRQKEAISDKVVKWNHEWDFLDMFLRWM